jgi:hypothetical protein
MGLERGLERGRVEEKKEMVLAMRNERVFPLDSISRVARVPVSQVEEWSREAMGARSPI